MAMRVEVEAEVESFIDSVDEAVALVNVGSFLVGPVEVEAELLTEDKFA